MSIEIGFLYFQFCNGDKWLIEIGAGQGTEGSFGAFMAKSWRFLGLYVSICKPTLAWKKDNGQV